MKAGANLLIAQFPSLGDAYMAMQAVKSGLDVLEMLPSSQGATLLAGGLGDQVEALVSMWSNRAQLRRIDNLPEAVIKAWLGLENPGLGSFLGIFESDDVGSTFEAATRWAKEGAQVFDLRILRGSRLRSYVLATGTMTPTNNFEDLNGIATVIPQPSAALRDFFEIAPR